MEELPEIESAPAKTVLHVLVCYSTGRQGNAKTGKDWLMGWDGMVIEETKVGNVMFFERNCGVMWEGRQTGKVFNPLWLRCTLA
jgi:hypothetical protein